jgi:uncharacterized delta-60 repeat protein
MNVHDGLRVSFVTLRSKTHSKESPMSAPSAFVDELGAQDLKLYEDGRILLVGTSSDGAEQSHLALLRLTPAGAPDPTFGDGGRVFTDVLPGGSDLIYAAALDQSHRILAVATVGVDQATPKTAVIRYLDNGSVDPDFGIVEPFDAGGKAGGILALAGDESLVAMNDGGPLTPSSRFVRLSAKGKVRAQFPYSHASAGCTIGNIHALKATRDGRGFWVIGGRVCKGPDGNGNYFAISRLDFDGNPDQSYGENGTAMAFVAPYGQVPAADALELDDGSLLVAGEHADGLIGGLSAHWVVYKFDPAGKRVPAAGSLKELESRLGNGQNRIAGLLPAPPPQIAIVYGSAMDFLATRGGAPWTYDAAAYAFDKSGFGAPSFGVIGRTRVGVDAKSEEFITTGAVDGAGNLLLAGAAREAHVYEYGFLFMRLKPDGTLDTASVTPMVPPGSFKASESRSCEPRWRSTSTPRPSATDCRGNQGSP